MSGRAPKFHADIDGAVKSPQDNSDGPLAWRQNRPKNHQRHVMHYWRCYLAARVRHLTDTILRHRRLLLVAFDTLGFEYVFTRSACRGKSSHVSLV